jgi:hypothetical protein
LHQLLNQQYDLLPEHLPVLGKRFLVQIYQLVIGRHKEMGDKGFTPEVTMHF